MKQVEKRLNSLENEINELKLAVMQKEFKKKVSLKGALKGAKIKDSDIEKAKKSLFKYGA